MYAIRRFLAGDDLNNLWRSIPISSIRHKQARDNSIVHSTAYRAIITTDLINHKITDMVLHREELFNIRFLHVKLGEVLLQSIYLFRRLFLGTGDDGLKNVNDVLITFHAYHISYLMCDMRFQDLCRAGRQHFRDNTYWEVVWTFVFEILTRRASRVRLLGDGYFGYDAYAEPVHDIPSLLTVLGNYQDRIAEGNCSLAFDVARITPPRDMIMDENIRPKINDLINNLFKCHFKYLVIPFSWLGVNFETPGWNPGKCNADVLRISCIPTGDYRLYGHTEFCITSYSGSVYNKC